MWVYRRLLKISWKDKIKNEDVLDKVNKKEEIFNTIQNRKFFGHIRYTTLYKKIY
jgi:hypothetical protein